MAEVESRMCPECEGAFDYPAPPPVDRRDFFRLAGAGVAAAAAGSSLRAAATPTATKKEGPRHERHRASHRTDSS